MKILFCGDRLWSDIDKISLAMLNCRHYYGPFTVIHGGARGADSLAGTIAEHLGLPVEVYPANWEQFGRAAGPIRNKQMLTIGKPDLVIAFHSNIDNSKGTKNMITIAKTANIPVEVIE